MNLKFPILAILLTVSRFWSPKVIESFEWVIILWFRLINFIFFQPFQNQTAPIIDELTKFVNSDLPTEAKIQQLVDGCLTPEFNDQMKSIYTALAFTEAILPSNYKISKKGSINFFDYTSDCRRITTYRFDKPHPGYNYEHLNMNPEYFNQPDPHIWLPPGTTTCMWICLIPVELLLWITRKCKTVLISAMALRSIANDLRFGTTRNCAETAVYAVGVTVSLFITAKIGKFCRWRKI